MKNRSVLISGAGIAGPALAYWLGRHGFRPTVVERAPALRAGGYAVDFRGAAHRQVLERMGIMAEVRRRQTGKGAMAIVDEGGRRLASLPAAFMSGDVEIARGDLSRILYDRSRDGAEYRFGDSIVSLSESAGGVDVTFAHGQPGTFDLVVGADGLHSTVRALVFGDESRFVRFLGHYVAIFDAPNLLDLDHAGLIYNVPTRGVSVDSGRDRSLANVMFAFAAAPLTYDRHDLAQQKRIVADAYRGVGWEVPRLLAALADAPDLYFDSISQVRLDHYARGRVALLGDAGYGATLGGLGTGLAVVAAYVLAGELVAAGGDHRTAFARYEEQIREYARGCQKLAEGAGPFLAPATPWAIWRRNKMYQLLSARPLVGFFNKMTTKAASAITLTDYDAAGRGSAAPHPTAIAVRP